MGESALMGSPRGYEPRRNKDDLEGRNTSSKRALPEWLDEAASRGDGKERGNRNTSRSGSEGRFQPHLFSGVDPTGWSHRSRVERRAAREIEAVLLVRQLGVFAE